ncbi:MAG TPA: 4-vinyl reductase [Myxococcota bacterium]|nr:4-vinyl reductase [Myxococcota bacterium]
MQRPSDRAGKLARDFDPAAVLDRDARVLLDPRFLGPLHDELWSTLGAEEAARTLRQIGLLHGLQDAACAVERLGTSRHDAFALPLAIRVGRPGARGGGLEIAGSWPEAREAQARLEYGLGPHGAACHLSAGYTSGWLSELFDAELAAIEVECAAEGRGACRFVARESAAWRRDEPELRWLHELPLAAYRSLVRERARRLRGGPAESSVAAIERESACVHLWGPVMVMPFGGPEEALRALELLERDPSAREVSVLVIDLRDAVIDEAFGALALEQIMGTASAWGAEVVLADPSPLSRHAIESLSHPPLLVAKSLEEGVATAFQVARAQRCRA